MIAEIFCPVLFNHVIHFLVSRACLTVIWYCRSAGQQESKESVEYCAKYIHIRRDSSSSPCAHALTTIINGVQTRPLTQINSPDKSVSHWTFRQDGYFSWRGGKISTRYRARIQSCEGGLCEFLAILCRQWLARWAQIESPPLGAPRKWGREETWTLARSRRTDVWGWVQEDPPK